MLQIIVIIGLSLLIVRWPYLGIAVTLASLPLTDILPEISWASSVITLVGGVTLGSFLLSQLQIKRTEARVGLKASPALVTGFLFALWIFLSNPAAAITPGAGGRIWILTFVQLWVFAWLTTSLINTPKKIDFVMFFFVIAAFISAFYASFQGAIGSSIQTSVRATGLAEGANSATRYFLIALMFILFIFPKQKARLVKILLTGAGAVLLYGILLTVSRTGLLLLTGGIGLYIIRNYQSRKIVQSIFILLLALLVVWLLAENIIIISNSILPSILAGTDTVGIRYGLWHAGIRMWFDHPIAGVGIGQFDENLARYGWDLLQPRYLYMGLGAHNMYIAVLSETGIIGLFLFFLLLALALQETLKAIRSRNTDISALAKNWCIVLILVLLAGLTKQDHYDKLSWIVIGIAVSIGRMGEREQNIQSN